jgi:ribosomal protein S18 acetylase RimI-like enzyme
MKRRPYRDLTDLDRMRDLLMNGRTALPDDAWWHVGDLEWTAFGPHGMPLSTIFHLWEDGGDLAGFVGLSESSFEYQVAARRRGTALEADTIEWAQRAVLAWRAANKLDARCSVECWTNDTHRIGVVEGLGYRATDRGGVIFHRDLSMPVDAPESINGFQIRGLRNDDIESRAITQNMAFSPGSKTTPATWRHLVENAPSYDRDLDNIAVDADGTTVAAALVWIDPVNKIGEFEPVGTRPSHQRRGLSKAVLLRGLAKMRERGMTRARVGTNATNAPAIAAYQSVGFTITHRITEYEWVA